VDKIGGFSFPAEKAQVSGSSVATSERPWYLKTSSLPLCSKRVKVIWPAKRERERHDDIGLGVTLLGLEGKEYIQYLTHI
jgi:hypothetical protein